jgi:hypothetical protein
VALHDLLGLARSLARTLIARGFALLAGFVTVVATMIIANRQIAASREEAKRVIAATREQTSVTGEQTSTTVRLERERVLSEDRAFRAMLEAAMARVLAEAVENHAHAMALHFLYYNFVRIHKTLKVTPAMAAGVTDRLWEVSDMVGVLEAWEAST